ncbi:putative rapid ALkalinization Factor [Lupinus albus]|uniref:Putative rapid ALkalinization Factor n=1 Tax=Lupinus albus TaxID=3870 RepID=A0A6A4QD54_LUPAL|nr:putative rapid ALkalinization Factor [Lupinus albus]
MANSFSFTFLIICATLLVAVTAVQGMGLQWVPTTVKPPCKGSIAECMEEGEEFELDSEINRRILATSSYISYGALQRNTVPCSRRGASYYNCRTGAQANPYNRGCSAITRCRS